MNSKSLDYEKMPGHWLLASLGKKVLRPGGLEMTRHMLGSLNVNERDVVVEFAPGLGVTAQMTLRHNPGEYIGIEQDEAAASSVRQYLWGERRSCIVASAEHTGLPDGSASIIYGEAMLTMQAPVQKQRIISEAKRLLRPGGKYAIHEMCLFPDDLDAKKKEGIQKDLSQSIRVNARPLTVSEWKQLLEEHGFRITNVKTAPMHLLRPRRMIQDEGLGGVLRIVSNVIRNPRARKRVLGMRRQFLKHGRYLQAVTLTAEIPE
ncbi:class I SAM-dependent methyltransferase [Cohnella fermenti]|uniref:Methyltransferase domain-containing protein n=1 Tax=Cohnella fermenti TaxID=2565925 RepID=A0A4S4BEL3_9BACL|nr:methyltransferase domain-containing protein [Cohnella fermenti]THF72610.1 methyltransferase domain-containing protein [Cohnella fermenti]